MVFYFSRRLAARSRTLNRKRSGDLSRAAFGHMGLFVLDDAGQHQNDDKRQRHSEQPEEDGHGGLRVSGEINVPRQP